MAKQREVFYVMNEKTFLGTFEKREEAIRFFNRLDHGLYYIALVLEEVNWDSCTWEFICKLGYIDPFAQNFQLLNKVVWRDPMYRNKPNFEFYRKKRGGNG